MPRTTISRSSHIIAAVVALSFAAGPAASGEAQTASSHTVRKGDTLWGIARSYLSDPFQWPQVYKLNTDVVKDPHWIYPGQVLRLQGAPGAKAVPDKDTPPPAAAPAAAATPAPEAEALQQPTPGGEDPNTELFRRKRVVNLENAFKTYREVKYHPLRPGEFFSAGYLTEGDSLPFGMLLGGTTPEQIESGRTRAAIQIFTPIALSAPAGASYAPGDSLVAVDRRDGPEGYGQIIVPTGLIKVTGRNGAQFLGTVTAVYGPMREGQSVLPAEKFKDPGAVEYSRVAKGIEGHILVPRDGRELRHPQEILFIDLGRSDGVAVGDLFEARRTPGPQPSAMADAVDEAMATLQVIHVRNHSATVKVLNVSSPDIKVGTRVRQVARLPG
jgi:LysM repeat protein